MEFFLPAMTRDSHGGGEGKEEGSCGHCWTF